MIEIDLACDHRVEMVLDQFVGEIPGKILGTFKVWDVARAPAFVGGRVAVCNANGEGRHAVQEDRISVVVEHDDRDVGLLVLAPFLGVIVAVKERLPVISLVDAAVERDANGWYMAGAQPTDEMCHLPISLTEF